MLTQLSKIWTSKPRIILGIMTGTSFDGIDLSLLKIVDQNTIKPIQNSTYSFPKRYKNYISELIEVEQNAKEYAQANSLYSELIIDSIIDFKNNYPELFEKIEAIGIHGQTIWHNPEHQNILNKNINSTWQLCDPQRISVKTGKIVISDFRSADIALGGQAAPLVPIFDYHFFKSKKNTICLNLGGMANLTFLPKDGNKNNIMAFDTGPGNVLIDMACKEIFNKDYDDNGDFAEKGIISEIIFNYLKKIPFIYKKPPKSTGRELFDKKLFNELLLLKKQNNINNYNFINSITEFTAYSIFYNIKEFAEERSEIIYSGGGGKNKYLINSLKKYLPKSNLISSDQKGISSTYKEAMAFAYIAWRTLAGLPSNIPAVTGSKKEAILGSISFP